MAPPHEEGSVTPMLDESNNDVGVNSTDENDYPVVDQEEEEEEQEVDDATLLKRAEAKASDECYLQAAALLRKVVDKTLLTNLHRHILELGERAERKKQHMFEKKIEQGGWQKQCEIHGHRDTVIYYKISEDASLHTRIETPIESSLINPFLSVCNESELYKTWMPSFRFPRLGVQASEKLQETGRGNQVIRVEIAFPMPFDRRECIQHAVAVDAIDEEEGCIIIIVKSLDEGVQLNGLEIPPPTPGIRRVDFDASIIIRPCPADHPALENSKIKYEGEKLLLVQVEQKMDAHVAGVPMNMVNFFTRTVLGRMWGALLQVAEDVRDGKREAHKEKIEENRVLYDWVESRVEEMLSKIQH